MMHNRNTSAGFFDSRAGTFRCGVDGEGERLRERAFSQKLHWPLPIDHSSLPERRNIVYPRVEFLLAVADIHDRRGNAARVSEPAELRLPTEERRLPPLETEAAPLPRPRMLPLCPAASGLPPSGAYAAASAPRAPPCMRRWSECVQHTY